MRKIRVFIRTNDNNHTGAIQGLMESMDSVQERPFEIVRLQRDEPFQEPTDRVFFTHHPIHCGTIYYQFDTVRSPNSQLEDYNKLVAFATFFEQQLVSALQGSEDEDLKQRVSSENLNSPSWVAQVNITKLTEDHKRRGLQSNNPDQSPLSSHYAHHPTYSFFANASNHSAQRAKGAFVGSTIFSLISIPLFFIEPISASILFVCALILLAVGFAEKEKAKQYSSNIVNIC